MIVTCRGGPGGSVAASATASGLTIPSDVMKSPLLMRRVSAIFGLRCPCCERNANRSLPVAGAMIKTTAATAPRHPPTYAAFDLSVGKSFGESWIARVAGTNICNVRYQFL